MEMEQEQCQEPEEQQDEWELEPEPEPEPEPEHELMQLGRVGTRLPLSLHPPSYFCIPSESPLSSSNPPSPSASPYQSE